MKKAKGNHKRKRIIKPTYEVCPFCEKKVLPSYKDFEILAGFVTDRARIVPATRSGVCSKHQRMLSAEVKNARFLALLPFTEGIK